MTFRFVFYDALSLGNICWTCRCNQVISYSRPNNIKNNSFFEVVFANLFKKSIINCLVTRRHITSVRILYAVDKLRIRNDNIQMDINYTIPIFRPNFSLKHEKKIDCWKIDEFIYELEFSNG
jgi:hypothetical protein